MDHSVRAYLRRRSDNELKEILYYCLQKDDDIHQDCVSIILEIFEERSLESDGVTL